MDIRQQLLNEMKLKKRFDYNSYNYKRIAESCGISYTGLSKWISEESRGMSYITLEKIADRLGKRIVLIDKDVDPLAMREVG